MKKWLVAAFSAFALALSAGVSAQQLTGFYAGAEIGNADYGPDDDTAFKLFGGYQFHRNIAAEVAYSMLADQGSTEITALEAVVVGLFPIANQLSVFGKLGFANIEVDSGGSSNDDTELTWGFGVQYDISQRLGVRAGWQRYETDNEVDLMSIGVLYRF